MNTVLSCIFGLSLLLHSDVIFGKQHAERNPSPDVPPRSESTPLSEDLCVTDPGTFVCKWVLQDGSVVDGDSRPAAGYLQIAGTTSLDTDFFNTGVQIIISSTRNMPVEIFDTLANTGRVGLFTYEDKTTIFPEYEYYRDRPECAGRCDGQCSNTCTGDGRKYDSLAGLGGIRATCVDDNYMCTSSDPYGNAYSVLIHEFAHTVHQYALTSDWIDYIESCYFNALALQIWDINSYGMSNSLEYFAEATGVFFHVNFHGSSSGGMNSCGREGGFCETEQEARTWLASQDPYLFDALSYVFTDYQDEIPGGLTVCP